MALKQADRLESNNPKAYGVVRAIEVSGHKTVSSLENLYTIADCILSDSKKNTNNDALGQSWYVVSEGISYQLINWESRANSAGWKKLETDLSSYVTTDQLKTETDKKQNKLYPGKGITIDEETNTISCELDAELFKIVSDLPEASIETTNKIYLKLSTKSGEENKYIEYITTVTTNESDEEVFSWERLGEYETNIDLTDYLKSSDAESIYLKLGDAETLYATKDEISDMETQTHASNTYQTISQAQEDLENINNQISGIVSDKEGDGLLTGYTSSEAIGDDLKIVETDTIKEGLSKLEKSISDNKTSAGEVVNSLGEKITENTLAISGLTEEVKSKASTDIATTSENGLMSSGDKTRLDGIFAGNLALPTPTITGTWKYFNNSSEEVSITPSGNKLEKGYKAQFVGTYKWTHDDAKKDPTQVQTGSSWTDLPASEVSSSEYDTGIVSTNTTVKIGIQAVKTGLMVSGTNVVPASGFDTTTASSSVTFLDRLYYGASEARIADITPENITELSGTELITSKSKTISDISCTGSEYYVYAYPKALGELSTIIQDGAAPVLGGFTSTNITVTNAAGLDVELIVYVSNNPGAFTNASLKFQ